MAHLHLTLFDQVNGLSPLTIDDQVQSDIDLNDGHFADKAAQANIEPGDEYRRGDHIRLYDRVGGESDTIAINNIVAIGPDVLDETRLSEINLNSVFMNRYKRRSVIRPWLALVLSWFTVIGFSGASAAEQMIVSNRNPGLAINAWGGAQFGTVLRLHNGCRSDNPDCTWHWSNGMIVSDRDPSLAINAWDGAQFGTVLRLHNGCRSDTPDCTWKQVSSPPPPPPCPSPPGSGPC